MVGWVKLHRKLIDSLVFKNEKCLKVWIWCLLKANHQENTTMLGRSKIDIPKGSFIMGSHTAKDTLEMAVSTIWYWLRFLESEGMVEIKNTNKYSLVKLKTGMNIKKPKANRKQMLKQMESKWKQTRMIRRRIMKRKGFRKLKPRLFWKALF